MRSLLRSRRAFALLAAGLGPALACVDSGAPPSNAAPGDLVLWASGSGQSGAFAVGGNTGAEAVPADAVYWILSPSQLVRADGGPPDVTWLEGVELVARGDSTGCGRCTGSVFGDPILVFPGDRCAIPRSAGLGRGSSPERAAEIARELEIAWPGECACREPSKGFDDTPVPKLRRISPSAGPPAQILAASSAGHVVGVSNLGVWLRKPDGELVVREPTPSCENATSAWTFSGALRAAAVSAEGEVIIVERPSSGREIAETRLYLTSPDLGEMEAFEIVWVVTTLTFMDALGPDRIALTGFRPGGGEDGAVLQICSLVSRAGEAVRTLECEEVPLPESLRSAGGVRGIASYGDQLLLLLEYGAASPSGRNLVILAADPGPPWTVRTITGPSNSLPNSLGVPASLLATQSFLVQGRRLSLCANANHNPSPTVPRNQGFVIDAELPDQITESLDDLVWTPRLALEHQCPPLAPGPGAQVRVLRVEDEAPRFVVAADPNGPPPAGLDGPPLSFVYQAEIDQSFVLGRDGALSVWRDTLTSTEAYESSIAGAEDATESFCPVEIDGRLVAVGSSGRLVEIDPAAQGIAEIRTASSLRGVSACAYHARRGQLFVAGRDESGPYARWIDLVSLTSTEIETPGLPRDAELFRAVDSGWGSVFVLGSTDLVLEVQGEEARRLEIDWDDPNTDATETEPDRTCCSFPANTGRIPISFDGIERPVGWLTDLDAHGGAVWLSARGPSFFRAFPGRLERAAYADAYVDPASIRADCGDRAFAAQLGSGPTFERGELIHLEREGSGRWAPTPVPGEPHFNDFGSGTPVAMFGPLDRLFTAFGRSSSSWGSLQAQGAFERRLVPGPIHRGAANANGDILVSAVGGQLYYGTACP